MFSSPWWRWVRFLLAASLLYFLTAKLPPLYLP
jgi:hypothetical protein